MIAPPTTSSVMLWPMPQKIPVSAALPICTLATNNGRDGNDVIGVGSVTHTEKETEGEDREKSHGKLTSRALICEDWFVWTEHD